MIAARVARAVEAPAASGGSAARLAPARQPPSVRDQVRLVVIAPARRPSIHPFASLPAHLGRGDLVVVNDAATWPASLGARTASGAAVELRLTTGAFTPGARVLAVLFGAGDWRTRTEDRAPPPVLAPGDVLTVGELRLSIAAVRAPRLIEIVAPSDDAGVRALFAAGRPVQYAHLAAELALWDTWTAYAGRPWAVEMPSAGRPLSWQVLTALASRGVAVASLTHAAGLSSTGAAALDATLPWREHYEIPVATARAIAAARAAGGRVIAIGTTVVRALESAVRGDEVVPGAGDTELILTAAHRRRVVDGLVSGLHDPAESHFRLLEAFAPRASLLAAWRLAMVRGLHGHELGDTQLVLAPR